MCFLMFLTMTFWLVLQYFQATRWPSRQGHPDPGVFNRSVVAMPDTEQGRQAEETSARSARLQAPGLDLRSSRVQGRSFENWY